MYVYIMLWVKWIELKERMNTFRARTLWRECSSWCSSWVRSSKFKPLKSSPLYLWIRLSSRFSVSFFIRANSFCTCSYHFITTYIYVTKYTTLIKSKIINVWFNYSFFYYIVCSWWWSGAAVVFWDWDTFCLHIPLYNLVHAAKLTYHYQCIWEFYFILLCFAFYMEGNCMNYSLH